MNEEDLRDCFAMFALAGAVMAGKSRTAEEVWQLADEMMKARKPKDETGIVAVKRSSTKKEK
jgi:mannose/cellobiose epimerase-like protein (N-acyl-D-glucosamine 2-epimerase family)